ncbi:MAG: hypothetical protein HDS26_01375 [Bacteroides sp.]|nr:hypothetical protein [Bacteroides sp.]
MRNLFYLFVAFIAACLIPGCISDDFTTSSSDLLSFSEDQVYFDTVFTDVGTPTARLKVYNRAKKSINISRIAFRNPSSNFQMNVDGVSGESFRDVEIRGGDSIFIFIECYIPANDDAEPFLVSDEIDFLTNGVTQSVSLQAWGQNVVRLMNHRVSSDLTLTSERPYVIFDSLSVEQGATLRIEPGARLLFHDKGSIQVHGRIEAAGVPGKMIDMRGDRLDNVLPDVAYDILAGQWEGIRIHPESFGNRLEGIDMRSTVSGLTLDAPERGREEEMKMTMVNSWLHNSQGSVFKALYCRTASYGVCFSDAAEAVVSLTGGNHDFSQVTFANEYLFAISHEAILTLRHCLPENPEEGAEERALMKATIDNSIIYGMVADISPGDLAGSEVTITRSSFNSSGSDDDNFISCFWDLNPLFLTRREDYIFNYHLQPDSPVIGRGDPALVAPETLIDMDGVDRLAEGDPALGAYAR